MGRVGGAISNAPVVSRLLDLLTLKARVLAAEVVAEHREQAVAVSTLEADGANGRPPHRAFDDAEGVLDARATGNERRRSCRRRPNPRRSRRRFRPSAERCTERLEHFPWRLRRRRGRERRCPHRPQ